MTSETPSEALRPGGLVAKYMSVLNDQIGQIIADQEALNQCAAVIAESLQRGEVLHVWGAGHSFMFAKEMFYRSGGLAPVNPLYDLNLIGVSIGSLSIADYDNLLGYGPKILAQHQIFAGECLILFTTPGVSVAAVDLAIAARERGLTTIGVCSLDYSSKVTPRHPTGMRLQDACDLVIDHPVSFGDAAVALTPDIAVGATGTITGMLICQLIALQVAENYRDRGLVAPIVQAGVVAGAAERNQEVLQPYRWRLKHL